MARKIIMTLGLPASGKSTWARQYVLDHPGTVRVCKDDLRAMLHSGVHSKGRENFVLAVRDFIADKALSEGHDCVIDDTNFHSKHRARMEEIAAKHGAVVEIKDFTDIPLEVCIERDLQRANSVGERVIRQMHRQYIAPKITPPVYNYSLLDVVICDIDGTLALFDRSSVNPYDRDFMKDEVNSVVCDLLRDLNGWDDIIIFSGRKEKHRAITEKWLKSNGIPYNALYMRRDDDDRKDAIVKEEFYNEHIRDKYNVHVVLDDRLSVCRLWYRLGLPLLRVGDPDADF